jgi:Na+-driven multidrug efflux pump
MIRNGIPTAIALTDYTLVLLLCYALSLEHLSDEAKQAIKYCMTITNIFIMTADVGIIETIGIYGSQAFGKRDHRRIYQLMC